MAKKTIAANRDFLVFLFYVSEYLETFRWCINRNSIDPWLDANVMLALARILQNKTDEYVTKLGGFDDGEFPYLFK